MKIEFLNDISNGGQFKDVVSDKLIRLFDFKSDEAEKFQKAIKNLIENEKRIIVDSLTFIKPVNCSLALFIDTKDLGIIKTGEKEFECRLTKDSYKEMVYLIQPFVDNESNGYQWLYDNMADIDLLFSPGGTW
jgi:hypothetical protein